MHLFELIKWLEAQDSNIVVKDGFGEPHSDRGSYDDLAFDPVEETTIGEMLAHAQSAHGSTFEGYKGGDFKMGDWTTVKIGLWGHCGEEITTTHLKYWLLDAESIKATNDRLVARVEALESDLANLLCIFEEIKGKTKEPEILKLAQNALHPKMRKAENMEEKP
jgi:hypothetical protein